MDRRGRAHLHTILFYPSMRAGVIWSVLFNLQNTSEGARGKGRNGGHCTCGINQFVQGGTTDTVHIDPGWERFDEPVGRDDFDWGGAVRNPDRG